MIKKPSNWESVTPARERTTLPAGGYIVKIVAAKVVSYPTRDGGSVDKLEIALDIAEGDYRGFYDNDFKAQTQEDKKWKGVLRVYIPKDDGSERDEWTKRSFKALTDALEDSNPGYHWDWDEGKLKGKAAGCLFRLEEWAMDGRFGWKTQPFKFIPAEQVRKKSFETPKFKPHRDHPNDTPEKYGGQSGIDVFPPAEDEDEGDFPF